VITRPYAIPHGELGAGLRAYLPPVQERRRRPLWPWLWVLVFVLGYLAGARAQAADVVALQVRPQFMIARRGDIAVQVRVPRSAENRLLSIAWSSDVGSAGSTLRPLEGEDAQVLHTLTLTQPTGRQLPVRGHRVRSRRTAARPQ
jgi:hypothetical protein